MEAACPHCQQKYQINESQIGVEFNCQSCNKAIVFGKPNVTNVQCHHCQQKYSIQDSQFGVEMVCSVCNKPMLFHAPNGAHRNNPTTKAKASLKSAPRSTRPETRANTHNQAARPASLQTSGNSNKGGLTVLLLLALIGLSFYGYKIYQSKQPQPEVVTAEPIVEKPVEVVAEKQPQETAVIAPPEKPTFELVIVRPDPSDKATIQPKKVFTPEEMKSLFKTKVQPFFEEHCVTCHGPKKERGDLRIDLIKLSISDEYTLFHIQNIIDEMAVDNMPPEDEERPDPAEVKEVQEVLRGLVDYVKQGRNFGGGRPLRRVTRSEFIYSIKDMLGVDIDKKELSDDLAVRHFETDVSVLLTTDRHIELFLEQSKNAVSQFIAQRDSPSESIASNFFAQFELDDEFTDNQAKAIISQFSLLSNKGRPVTEAFKNQLHQIFLDGKKLNIPSWEAIVDPLAISLCSIESLIIFEESKSSEKLVTGLELANRLSYTLWRSIPDQELITLAQSGKLLEPAIKEEQIQRMMDDPKFDRFINDFTDQWLELPRQVEVAIDQRVYEDFDPDIKPMMRQETVSFMDHLIRANLPLINLIDSEFMILNEPMAKYYGISGVSGDNFRAVPRENNIASQLRGGILTHAGILLQGSNGDSTSPIERGAFIARKIIDRPPSDPPPNVNALPTNGDNLILTASEILKQHTLNPQCASCHAKFDPLGLALEGYDVIGMSRTEDRRLHPDANSFENGEDPVVVAPISTKGKLYDGQPFDGTLELKRVLMTKRHDLAKGFLKALLTYANGRQANLTDHAIIDEIIEETHEENYPVGTIIKKVMLSDIMIAR